VCGAGIDVRKRCAALPEEMLAILKHRAEEALAADGVAHPRLKYEVLVKLTRDELLEQECLPTDACEDGGQAAIGATKWAQGTSATRVPIPMKTSGSGRG
jgi:hypothetical protein